MKGMESVLLMKSKDSADTVTDRKADQDPQGRE